jgi:hypothetical protein
LQNFPSFVLKNASLQEDIKSTITKAADGMFLLAQLYVDSLVYKTTPRAIRLALGELGMEAGGSNDDNISKTLDRARTPKTCQPSFIHSYSISCN